GGGGSARRSRNGGKSVESKDEGERLVNVWRTNRGKPRRDTADTASGKDRCSVTEEAKKERKKQSTMPQP
ncbi:hypothetical protein K0M31_004531, partial [Melipona bicolor]